MKFKYNIIYILTRKTLELSYERENNKDYYKINLKSKLFLV